ncbi:YlxR family protein [Egibacter rhizosphaerae]|uniref:YlxR family protein n=1 Tax=Egibacter rhizosphaerae TaxID=1670831 RepID=A0A411YCS4_9ACTN|nr:YlxR family protein [Egibacter rhizosphaerae]QBI18947.1 YlxR family protein [Egibacter rhizosphaerae]
MRAKVGSASDAAHVPIRTCVGCRRRQPRTTLLRVVVRGGRVEFDPEARAPGRGAWLCSDAACLEQALRKEARPFRRALRAPDADVDAARLRASFGEARRDIRNAQAGPSDGPPGSANATRGAAKGGGQRRDDAVVRE